MREMCEAAITQADGDIDGAEQFLARITQIIAEMAIEINELAGQADMRDANSGMFEKSAIIGFADAQPCMQPGNFPFEHFDLLAQARHQASILAYNALHSTITVNSYHIVHGWRADSAATFILA